MPSKQVIILRTDFSLSPGKAIAQGAHASLKSYQNAPEDNQTEWENTHHTKIALGADSETALINLADAASDAGLPYALIEDKGWTEVEEGTTTALAIGPADATNIDSVTGQLSLY